MQKNSVLILIFFLLTGTLFAQYSVSKVGSSGIPSDAEGMFYSLPQTVIQVDIVVNKIQKIKGPYAEYAEQLLGLNEVTSVNSTEYELKDIRLSAYTEPDPSQYYFITKSGRKKDSKPLELFLSDAGVIAGAGITPGSADSHKQKSKDVSPSQVNIPEITNPSVFERMDTVIKRISLDTTIIEQKFFRKTSAAKSVEQKAREAADFVLKLDESMYNLINGYQEVNYEKGTMEFMYNRMNSMKQDYLELFKGVTSVSSETYTFYCVADKYVPTENLCKFSISKGILPKTAGSGDLIQIQATSLNRTTALAQETDKLNADSRNARGLFYRVPDKASVNVKLGGQVIIETQFLISQFGVVTFLPATGLQTVTFDSNSGSLRHVIIE
jgi:hypothetical protein